MSILDNLDWRESVNDNARRCERCEAPFAGNQPKKRFCSEKCRRRSAEEKIDRHANAPERICEGCGTTFKRKGNSKDKARFCSRECSYRSGANREWADPVVSWELREYADASRVSFKVARCVCRQCETRFIGHNIASTICSEGCKHRAHWERRGVDCSDRTCPECGVVFVVTYGRGAAKFCSDECSKRHNGRASKWRRKARIRAVANDNINPFDIFDRDGWRCKMCGVKTPKRLRGTYEDDAPELDHIMPISLGGTHTANNVQCACRKCNMAKGATPMGQMLLFG